MLTGIRLKANPNQYFLLKEYSKSRLCHEEISKYSSNVIISNEANTDESLINHLKDANIGADNYKSNIILGSYNLGKKAKDKDD